MTREKSSPILSQLREQLLVGRSPEEAAHAILDPYGGVENDPLCRYVWPVILKAARDCEGKLSRASRNEAFFGDDSKGNQETRLHLPKMVYRMPNGSRVLWDDLTLDKIEAKIAYLRTQIGGLVDHLSILISARRVLQTCACTRLGDVPGWVDLVREGLGSVTPDDIQELTPLPQALAITPIPAPPPPAPKRRRPPVVRAVTIPDAPKLRKARHR